MATSLWTVLELKSCVDAYALLWISEQRSEGLVKAQVIEGLLDGPLRARSKGAVEYRFANISAIMAAEGQPILTGYVPACNVGPTNSKLIRGMLNGVGLLP